MFFGVPDSCCNVFCVSFLIPSFDFLPCLSLIHVVCLALLCCLEPVYFLLRGYMLLFLSWLVLLHTLPLLLIVWVFLLQLRTCSFYAVAWSVHFRLFLGLYRPSWPATDLFQSRCGRRRSWKRYTHARFSLDANFQAAAADITRRSEEQKGSTSRETSRTPKRQTQPERPTAAPPTTQRQNEPEHNSQDSWVQAFASAGSWIPTWPHH